LKLCGRCRKRIGQALNGKYLREKNAESISGKLEYLIFKSCRAPRAWRGKPMADENSLAILTS
jgi:hypothetical protein